MEIHPVQVFKIGSRQARLSWISGAGFYGICCGCPGTEPQGPGVIEGGNGDTSLPSSMSATSEIIASRRKKACRMTSPASVRTCSPGRSITSKCGFRHAKYSGARAARSQFERCSLADTFAIRFPVLRTQNQKGTLRPTRSWKDFVFHLVMGWSDASMVLGVPA